MNSDWTHAFVQSARCAAFVTASVGLRARSSFVASRTTASFRACKKRKQFVRPAIHCRPHASSLPSRQENFAAKSFHTLASLSAYFITQRVARTALVSASIAFPPPLAAMLALLCVTIILRAFGADHAVDNVLNTVYAPAGALLSRWLAVFFVPNLVMLPLAPALPRAELLKIAIIVVFGYMASLVSSAAVSLGIRSAIVSMRNGKPLKDAVPTPTKPFLPSTDLIANLGGVTWLSFVLATAFSRLSVFASLPLFLLLLPGRIYALALTLLTFCAGQRIDKRIKPLLHPLVTCTIGTIVGMWLLAKASGALFTTTLACYYIRNQTVTNWGGGNILALLLGPAVISFAFQMDARRNLLRSRFMEVVGTSFIASVIGLFGTAALARALRASPIVRIMVIPRMITAPLAVSIAEILGAPVAMAASIVAVTGLLGANLSITFLNALRVEDPVARGLAAGSSAHGLGTAAMAEEPAAFPFAALSMALVGIFSTLLVATPALRALLLKVAVGSIQHVHKVSH